MKRRLSDIHTIYDLRTIITQTRERNCATLILDDDNLPLVSIIPPPPPIRYFKGRPVYNFDDLYFLGLPPE